MLTRIWSGLVLLGVGFAVIFFGGPYLFAWILFAALFSMHELFIMSGLSKNVLLRVGAYIVVGSAFLALFFFKEIVLSSWYVALVFLVIGFSFWELIGKRPYFSTQTLMNSCML